MWPQYWLCENLHRYWRNDAQKTSRIWIWLRISTTRGCSAITWSLFGQPRPPPRLLCFGCAWPLLHGPKWPLILLVFTEGFMQFIAIVTPKSPNLSRLPVVTLYGLYVAHSAPSCGRFMKWWPHTPIDHLCSISLNSDCADLALLLHKLLNT